MRWLIYIFFLCVSSDKKCTYGIKCKYYHPERANQSHLSLADELREKAHISAGKEERNARSPPKHVHSEVHASHHHYDSNTEKEKKSPLHIPPVSENKILYREDPRKSPNHKHCQIQKEWPGMPSTPSHYYANMSHEYLDSGFGSYDSQYSDFSHCLSSSHRLRPQQQSCLTGPMHLETNNSQVCMCCSHVVPPQHQHHGNLDSKGQPKYDTYPPHMFPHAALPQKSLPNHLHYSGVPHHQQAYWSDPFQVFPQARGSSSLPSAIHTAHSHNSCCSYNGPQYTTWGQQQPPQQQQSPSVAFDPRRLELRKKLQAIFNPSEVDTVMEMFPHLMDAEKLAAEILNLKAQRGIF